MSVLVDNKFRDQHDMTIGVEFGSKILAVGERTIKLQIWDTVNYLQISLVMKTLKRLLGLTIGDQLGSC